MRTTRAKNIHNYFNRFSLQNQDVLAKKCKKEKKKDGGAFRCREESRKTKKQPFVSTGQFAFAAPFSLQNFDKNISIF